MSPTHIAYQVATIPNNLAHPLDVLEIDAAIARCITNLPKTVPDAILQPIQLCAVQGGLVILVQMLHS